MKSNKLLTNGRVKIFLIILIAILLAACSNGGAGSPINMENSKPDNMGNTVENLNNSGEITYDSSNIYYLASDENNMPVVYKSDVAGTNRTILLQEYASCLNAIDGWVYYRDFSRNNIYKISADGGKSQKLADIAAYFMLAYKDRLYIIADYTGGGNHLYSMNLDGTDLRCLSNDKVSCIYIYKDGIYLSSSPGIDEKGYFSKMGLDGSNMERIFDNGYAVLWFCVYNDYIYYVGGHTLYRADIHGNNQSKIADLGEIIPATYNFDNGTFYYSTFDLNGIFAPKPVMHQLDVDTGAAHSKKITFLNKPGINYEVSDYIVGDKIFRNENGEFFVMNLDGSNIRAWEPKGSVSLNGNRA